MNWVRIVSSAVFCSFYSSFGVYILMENISNDSWQLVASAFSVSPCSTLPTLINLCCFAHPANNVHGIAVDYPLSCWFWNNAIAHSHFSNAFWFICRLIILYSSNGLRSGFTDVIAHIFPTNRSIFCSLAIWYLTWILDPINLGDCFNTQLS